MTRVAFPFVVMAPEGEYHLTVRAHLEAPAPECGWYGGWILDRWSYEPPWVSVESEDSSFDRPAFQRLFGQTALDLVEQAACDNACGEMESARIEGSERA